MRGCCYLVLIIVLCCRQACLGLSWLTNRRPIDDIGSKGRTRRTLSQLPIVCSALSPQEEEEEEAPRNDIHNNNKNNQQQLPFTNLTSVVRRVFCLSDLHTDHVENLEWIRQKMESTTRSSGYDDEDEDDGEDDALSERDLIVVAGDISHDLDTVLETLRILRRRCQVFFIPGNHEAWIHRNDHVKCSIKKMNQIREICQNEGVYSGPLLVTNPDTTATSSSSSGIKHSPLWIIPLDCWYDGSLSFSEDLCHDFGKWPWMDFQKCVWPETFPAGHKGTFQYRIPVGLVNHFLEENRVKLRDTLPFIRPNHTVMTVSHFLPNQQCLPDWKDLESSVFDMDQWLDHGGRGMSAKFAKVAGSSLLDEQLRSLFAHHHQISSARHIHVFGHSHRPKDFMYRGIRYIHNPLGKPRERNMHMVSPDVDLQLIWDSEQGEIPGETVLRYWEEKGGGLQALVRRLETMQSRRSRYRRA